jgi:hypothetical protein
MRLILLVLAVTLLLDADDRGVPPRAQPSDYAVHQTTGDVTMAAAIVPSRQIEKMFSAEVARQYIVVEVAVYPQNGRVFDLDWFDFGLKIGDTVAYVELPRDVATPWREKNRIPDKPVTVTSDTGVVYTRSSDPVYGRRSGWEVYQGVGVTNDPRAATPPDPPRQDPQRVEQRVLETMIPQGPTSTAVAGYLFFPQYNLKRHKGDAMELQWRKDQAFAVLRLPQK